MDALDGVASVAGSGFGLVGSGVTSVSCCWLYAACEGALRCTFCRLGCYELRCCFTGFVAGLKFPLDLHAGVLQLPVCVEKLCRLVWRLVGGLTRNIALATDLSWSCSWRAAAAAIDVGSAAEQVLVPLPFYCSRWWFGCFMWGNVAVIIVQLAISVAGLAMRKVGRIHHLE